MATKILGLDLGTNSIGWSIRDIEVIEDNQIVKYGVTVFKKGVGDGKSGEFSLAAERRKNRGKRRLYNAKRYRKWELLKILIEHNMCPLTKEELRLWSIGNWQVVDGKNKNLGRIYPIDNQSFQRWLAFDPILFGKKGTSKSGKTIRNNPYDIRCELIDGQIMTEQERKYKIGRALYHLVQRRGFKSNRKSGKSVYAENEALNKLKAKNPDFQITVLAKERIDKGERFRASGVIQRKYFEDEFNAICLKQNIDDELKNKLYKAIYYVRHLRTQKGLVGTCTLEIGKPRIPISHPKFEEFRALQFINNIQWRETGTRTFSPIPIDLKKKIFKELYFKVNEKGVNKGQVNTRSHFPFEEIVNHYSENYRYEFNYAKYNTRKLREEGTYELQKNPSVSTCPVIAGLMNVFSDTWKKNFITDENKFGINWDDLILLYKVQYGRNSGVQRQLTVDDIWHLLFDYLQTKDKPEELEDFCKKVLQWSEERTEQFTDISIQQGYGSLSYNAISKILPFLHQGFIYSTAVSYANLKQVLGDKYETNRKEAYKIITQTKEEIDSSKEILNITNGLIQKYFVEFEAARTNSLSNRKIDTASIDILEYLKEYFGSEDWAKIPILDQDYYAQNISKYYLNFLEGVQKDEEKASSKPNGDNTRDYYKLPRLDSAIKQNLQKAFDLSNTKLQRLYHPSDIEMYNPNSVKEKETIIDDKKILVKQLGSPQPPSKGWKNPMAMRTMYELRKLLNYLLQTGQIDPETKIVIEMARELNDANKRWAIETYQHYREEENKEFAKAIIGVAKNKYPNIDEHNTENINQVRLWWEQIPNNEDIYKQIKTLKEDIDKYRLWKEQQGQCLYTGKMLSITDLFDGTSTNIDHTLPISDSFDDSLSNKTVVDLHYNQLIKKDKLPTQLDNYNKDAGGYTAIKPRLLKWEEKVKHLRELIEDNKLRTKKAQDPESKKGYIQKRRLYELELDYWDKKLRAFTVTELPNTWKNSQLVDTQIITKYARAYLKTLFNKVDVQKASVNNIFKKIYGVKGDEQKDRSKHSHHAIDAAVLTLIPGSARREAILKDYYLAEEQKRPYKTIPPYSHYRVSHVLDIENNILINHSTNDTTTTETTKKIRKRGKIVFLRDKRTNKYIMSKDGKKIPLIAKGDTIRGHLHKDTFLGATKVPERDEQGNAIKINGKYLVRNDEKTQRDIVWVVAKKELKELKSEDFEKPTKGKEFVVDEPLRIHIKKQLDNGIPLLEVVDFQSKKIRHIRCRYTAGQGYLNFEKVIELKRHSHPSLKDHKRFVLTQNSEDGNFLYLLYVDENNNREARIISLFEFSNEYKFDAIGKIRNDHILNKTEDGIPLKYILKAGQLALFYSQSKEELQQLTNTELQNRCFKIYKFNEVGTPYIYLQNHLEARPEDELGKLEKKKDGFTEFNKDIYQYRLKLKANKLNCIFEGKDFEMKPDGSIIFIASTDKEGV